MKSLTILTLILITFACGVKTQKEAEKQEKATPDYKLELIWSSDTSLRTPESVIIDRTRNMLYVSCVNENPWEQDGNGFISKMDRNGKIINLKWIQGLDGPKGMGISGNSLFIADINTLVEADIESGKIVHSVKLDGKPDLNDITVDKDGNIYVSGSGTNIVYKLEDGELKKIFEGEDDERFNGLYWEKDRMLLITSGSSQFKEIPWNTMQAKLLSENMGHGDGIAPDGNGNYLTSSWKGAINLVLGDGKVIQLFETESKGINTADIDFCIEKQILYVPTFYDNRVNAYKLTQ